MFGLPPWRRRKREPNAEQSPAKQPRDRFRKFQHPDPNPRVVITGPEAERLLARMRPRSYRPTTARTQYDELRY